MNKKKANVSTQSIANGGNRQPIPGPILSEQILDNPCVFAYLLAIKALLHIPSKRSDSKSDLFCNLVLVIWIFPPVGFGGETASTGTKKLRLHTELLSAR